MNELMVTFAGQTYLYEPGQIVTVGRSAANSIVVPDPIVSREHARVTWQPDGWVLDDLGKGRTYVGGLPVGAVRVQQPLDVRLASPLGPALLIELADAAVAAPVGSAVAGSVPIASAVASGSPSVASAVAGGASSTGAAASRRPDSGAALTEVADAGELSSLAEEPRMAREPDRSGLADLVKESEQRDLAGLHTRGRSRPSKRHPSAVHRSRLWRGDVTASQAGPAHEPFAQVTTHHARPESPGGDFATAMHILVPVRSWLKDPGWKQGSRLLVIAYGLLPSLFVVLFSTTTHASAPGWAYSLAIAPLWAVAFWLLIRPGHITKLIGWLAVGISGAVLLLLPTVAVPWENALDNTADLHNVMPWIYGVGLAEETAKALPILVAALLMRWIWKVTLDVRVWMFLGTIAGLAFGVRESVLYTSSYLMNRHEAGLAIPLLLTFAQRVFVDGFQHAVWTGIAAFFIGMGVNYRRRRVPLIIFGITLPTLLHGLNDWSTQLASHWLWLVFGALSLLLFIGYTMSAATIERQVRDTPLFRGESMIMDRAVDPAAPTDR